MNLWAAKLVNRLLALRHPGLRRRDAWFFEHYHCTARHIVAALRSAIGREYLRTARVLEIGCGDGITALSVSRQAGEVHAVDLTRAFDGLADKLAVTLGAASLPAQLHFHQVREDAPLPFADASFDAIYSWSVFEHIADVPRVLADAFRVLRADGALFIQIAPLYYSAFGSHLRRLGIRPWEHLTIPEEHLAEELTARLNRIDEREKDWLLESSSSEAFADYLLGEYRQLNRITAHELRHAATQAGFEVQQCQVGREPLHRPDSALLARFDRDRLLERELWLLLRKRRAV